MDKISIYENSKIILERTCPKIIIIWILSTIILIITLLLFSTLYKYNKIISKEGIVIKEGREYYVQIYAKSNIEISKSNQVLINNKIYKYEIIKNYYNKEYYLIYLKINLEECFLIENNIIKLKFKLDKTTLLNEILNYIRRR